MGNSQATEIVKEKTSVEVQCLPDPGTEGKGQCLLLQHCSLLQAL